MSTSTRRDFLKVTGAAVAMTALSQTRAVGANDRIRIGQIGCGGRGCGAHMVGIHPYDKSQNIEIVAVCDPWKVAREKAASLAKDWYGKEPKQFSSYRDLLEFKDVDAVMIASPDHLHTLHLEAAAKAKKDVYVEKPLSMDLESLKSSCDAVKANNVVCQVGTQLRSMSSMTGCRELYKTGILGTLGRVEQCRNNRRPYWYAYMKEAKEEDVDWKEFLHDRPMRPFDPVQFTGWYGYRDFSDGPVPGFGSHYLDLIHYITGAKFPTSAVCLGGTYTFKDEHKFTCPDHVQALWTYPEGFMVSYSTYFGSDNACSFKMVGNQGMLDLQDWSNPFFTTDGVDQPSNKAKEKMPVENVDTTDHMLNWLECLRSRQTPNASIDAGYQHGVADVMAVKAFDTGRRQIYDVEKREIREG
jgi:predicted dehydrogenase